MARTGPGLLAYEETKRMTDHKAGTRAERAARLAGQRRRHPGLGWRATAMGLHPDYAGEMLGGMALTGIGIGLTVPTLFGVAVSSLPPQRFATGSGAVNMIRQIGITVGVAVLVAVVGTPRTGNGELAAFRHGWLIVAAISLACALTAVLLHRPSLAAEPRPAAVPDVRADAR